jgi:predicted acetyltransferase
VVDKNKKKQTVSMKVKLVRVKITEKEILKNLLEKYNYEFSQYEKTDVNKLGLYGYDWLDYYWTTENRFPYFILVDNIFAGFVLVNDYPQIKMEMDYSIAEYFVMYKYRCLGIGKYIVYNILNKYKGKWQIKYHPKNTVSVKFWNNVIREYTNGEYKIIKNDIETIYRDGTIGEVIIFDNKNMENRNIEIK